MDTLLVEGYAESMNLFKYSPDSFPPFLGHQICDSEVTYHDDYLYSEASPNNRIQSSDLALSSCVSSDGENAKVPDFPDACLKFMSEILMEEDLQGGPATLEEYDALQATERALYDVLQETYPPTSDQLVGQTVESLDDSSFNKSWNSFGSNSSVASESVLEPIWPPSQIPLEPFQFAETLSPLGSDSNSHSSASLNTFDDTGIALVDSPVSTNLVRESTNEVNFDWIKEAFKYIPNWNGESRGRKNHERDDDDYQDGRSSKQPATYEEDNVQLEQFDDVLLCKDGKNKVGVCENESSPTPSSKLVQNGNSKRTKGRSKRGKKQSTSPEDLVDLTSLITHCAQAVASFDIRTANDLLKQIRQHSSPAGSSIQRLAHYFANGLEARLAGTGAQLSNELCHKKSCLSHILKAFRVFATAIPFKRTSYFLANQSIAKLAGTAKQIHIIDFGIFCGFQWPCFIQKLSNRPNGPPKLRITGIDFPESGFRPARVVDETGRRLTEYCERFNVPFEYHGIAQKWETIRAEDLKIEKDEFVVVNCMFHSGRLLDETVDANSPRDAFLRLVKKLNPQMFIHGIVNGAFSAPFFITRFKEALFYYSSVFDLFEATIPGEDQERILIERELYGKAALNLIACEGVERVERPETYKQWQVRMLRAGFRQLQVDQDLMKEAKDKVKGNYHKDFVVGEDNRWVLQGWKGKILYALSLWKSA